MKSILSIILFGIIISTCGNKSKDDKQEPVTSDNTFLLPYQVGSQWGLADTLGNIKVQPQYDAVIDFMLSDPSYTYYLMKKKNEICFIDADNKRYFKNLEIVQSADQKIHFKKNGKIGNVWPEYHNGTWEIDENPALYIYDHLYDLPGDFSRYTMTEINGKKGMKEFSEDIIPASYDSISYHKNGSIVTFKGYQKKDGKTEGTTITTRDLNFPPPPSVSKKRKPVEQLLAKRELTGEDKGWKKLREYKYAYDYDERYPTIVKDNTKELYAYKYPNTELDFAYDDIFIGLNQVHYNDPERVIVARKGNKFGFIEESIRQRSSGFIYDLIEQRLFKNKEGQTIPYLIAKKGKKTGMIVPNGDTKAKDSYLTVIPFEFDDITDQKIVIRNGLYGVWFDVPRKRVKIEPRYTTKPVLYKNISYNNKNFYVYEATKKNNKKVLVFSNGLELYK